MESSIARVSGQPPRFATKSFLFLFSYYQQYCILQIIDAHNEPMSLDLWEFTIAVNLTGTFNLTRLALKHLVTVPSEGSDGERGIVIMVASSAAVCNLLLVFIIFWPLTTCRSVVRRAAGPSSLLGLQRSPCFDDSPTRPRSLSARNSSLNDRTWRVRLLHDSQFSRKDQKES